MAGRDAILTEETFRFFRELNENNSKAWMDENRDRYRQHVVAPLRSLLEALTPAVKGLNPSFNTSGRTGQSFSRINRDIRFSKDKTPYRPQMYLMFATPAAKGLQGGQLYVGVNPGGVTAGFRVYGDRRKGPLAEIARPRVLKHPEWLAATAKKLGRRYESYWHATEKREWVRHDGWPKGAADWERLEAWIVRRVMSSGDALKPPFLGNVVKIFQDVMPIWSMTSAPRWKP